MKLKKMFLFSGAALLLIAAAVFTGCKEPAADNSALNGVWEIKSMGKQTYPIVYGEHKTHMYMCFDSGTVYMASKTDGKLVKNSSTSYTIDGNTIKGNSDSQKFKIEGKKLTVGEGEREVIAEKVDSPTVDEIKNAPEGNK